MHFTKKVNIGTLKLNLFLNFINIRTKWRIIFSRTDKATDSVKPSELKENYNEINIEYSDGNLNTENNLTDSTGIYTDDTSLKVKPKKQTADTGPRKSVYLPLALDKRIVKSRKESMPHLYE